MKVVCVCVRVLACTHERVFMCVCAHRRVRICVYVSVCAHVWASVHVCVHTHEWEHVSVRVSKCVCVSECVCDCVCVFDTIHQHQISQANEPRSFMCSILHISSQLCSLTPVSYDHRMLTVRPRTYGCCLCLGLCPPVLKSGSSEEACWNRTCHH